jgi:hypothetical protein
MSLITITETGSFTDQPNATLSFDHGAPQPITITDPFSDVEEARLRWYFEEHLRFPFTDRVHASQSAQSIVAYGEALSRRSSRAIRPLCQIPGRRASGLQNLHFDIIGSPAFHQLHWEPSASRTRPLCCRHGAAEYGQPPGKLEMPAHQRSTC